MASATTSPKCAGPARSREGENQARAGGARETESERKTDGADGVVENAVVAPLFEGLFLSLGEAEVDLGAEEVVDAQVAIGGEEFLGAEEAEGPRSSRSRSR